MSQEPAPPANIFTALAAVMNDVQGVGKKERNTTPGQSYVFRGIDAVTNAVGPALRKHGVIVVPTVLEKVSNTVTVGKNRTEMSHCELTVEYTWYAPDGTSVRCVVAAEAMDSGDKAVSKAHSVAFRTAMIQTLCLPTDEPDPDSQTYERSAPQALAANWYEALELVVANGDMDSLREMGRQATTAGDVNAIASFRIAWPKAKANYDAAKLRAQEAAIAEEAP